MNPYIIFFCRLRCDGCVVCSRDDLRRTRYLNERNRVVLYCILEPRQISKNSGRTIISAAIKQPGNASILLRILDSSYISVTESSVQVERAATPF